MKAKPTLAYLQGGEKNALTTLMQRVEKMQLLSPLISEALPSDLAPHCRLANLRPGGQLILQVDSPIWGTKLRFELSALLTRLRQSNRLAGLSSIDYFVAPFPAQFEPTIPRPVAHNPPLSIEIRHLILSSAKTYSDPSLRAVMEKIGQAKGKGV